MNERSIIHINVADFAVAVERLVDSRLRGRPVIIAPGGAARAAVYDMSEESYQNGVRKGMTLTRALGRCRDAVVLPPRPARYERAMTRLVKHALPYSPLIEMTDHNGHLFVDATRTGRLFGPPPDVAWRIRKAVRTDMGFDPVWSVAPNKLIAKVATRMVKPDGEYVIGAGEEQDFLNPVPLHLIPGIEREDLKRFREFNLTLAGHVIHLSMGQLNIMFGTRSGSLYHAVRGMDPSPVLPVGQMPPIVVADHEFATDTNPVAVVHGALYGLAERAGANLRKSRLTARRIKILLEYSDGRRSTRQAVAHPATANDVRLFVLAKRILERAWTRRAGIRHLRLICDRLTYPPAQMGLFASDEKENQMNDSLMFALDTIRRRFGFNAIRVGRNIV